MGGNELHGQWNIAVYNVFFYCRLVMMIVKYLYHHVNTSTGLGSFPEGHQTVRTTDT